MAKKEIYKVRLCMTKKEIYKHDKKRNLIRQLAKRSKIFLYYETT